jgi:4-amino-4-deoxy-L-arabinose transferase-like glycosyltransferase
MAFLFKIFGSSVLVARAVLVIYGGLFSSVFYFLARRVCSRWTSVFTVYLFTLTCLPYEFRALHNWDSTFWACLALYFAIRHLESSHWGFALATGTSASLTLLFEQSKGAGLVLGLALGFGLLAWKGRHRIAVKPVNLIAFLAGLTVPTAITLVYFSGHRALLPMLADCLWALRHYSSANRLPYGYAILFDTQLQRAHLLPWGLQLAMTVILSPFLILPVLPLMAAGVFAFSVFRLTRRKELDERECYFVVVSAVLVGLLLAVLASGRPDVSHLVIFNGPLFFLVLAWALETSLFRSAFLDTARTVASLYLLFSFTALGLVFLRNPLNAHALIQTRRGTLKAERSDAVINEIQSRVQPGGRIFVYPYQPLYYYLTGTINPTRFEYLQLGVNTPEQLREAIRTLQASRVPVVVFQPSFPEFVPHSWPATPLHVLGAEDAMTEYILAHYRPCATLRSVQMWQFVFMVRRDLKCDGPL